MLALLKNSVLVWTTAKPYAFDLLLSALSVRRPPDKIWDHGSLLVWTVSWIRFRVVSQLCWHSLKLLSESHSEKVIERLKIWDSNWKPRMRFNIHDNLFTMIDNLFTILDNLFTLLDNLFTMVDNLFTMVDNLFTILDNLFRYLTIISWSLIHHSCQSLDN